MVAVQPIQPKVLTPSEAFPTPPSTGSEAHRRNLELYEMYGSAYWYAVTGRPIETWPAGWQATIKRHPYAS